jgi:hypothetical protein
MNAKDNRNGGNTMNLERSLRLLSGILLLVAATLVLASTANAKTFAMSGEWAMNRGVLVDIPINGGPQVCFAAVEPKNALNPLVGGGDHGGCVNEGKTTLAPGGARFAFPRTASQPVLGFKQKNGGIPGNAIMTAMGASPASFTIPDGVFNQVGAGFAVTVSLAPDVVQLNTTLDALGPADAGYASGAIPRFDVQQPARFMANAWSNDPGQTAPLTTQTSTTTSMTGSPPTNTVTNTNYLGPGVGIRASQQRGAANFTWCPATVSGSGAGVCIGTEGEKPGLIDGRVRYVAGANKFGGTMAMLLKGFGTTSVRFPDIIVPATTMTPAAGGSPIGGGRTVIPAVAHLTFAMANTFMQPQANGVGYAFNNTIQLSGAPIHLDFKTTMSAIVAGARVYAGTGLLSASGPTVGAAPGDTNNNFGFPWTTGAISVRAKELSPGSGPGTHTLTGQGADSRTPEGKGKITLVAGGTANRVVSGSDFQALEVVTLNFKAPPATPSMGPAGLSTVALLMALSAGYAIRRRFDSSEK